MKGAGPGGIYGAKGAVWRSSIFAKTFGPALGSGEDAVPLHFVGLSSARRRTQAKANVNLDPSLSESDREGSQVNVCFAPSPAPGAPLQAP